MDKDELIKRVIDCDMQRCLKECFNLYGLEGTEDKLKEIYKHHPILLQKYLGIYKGIIDGI